MFDKKAWMRAYAKREDVKARRKKLENSEHRKALAKEYAKKTRALHRKKNAEYARNRVKETTAKNAVKYALKVGKLIKPAACEDCGTAGRIHGHHDDYSRKLDVRWLCPQCHTNVHMKGNENGMEFT
jgi:ribosomal protein S27AE